MKRFIVMLILTTVIAGALTYAMPKSFDNYVSEISADATISIYCRKTNLDGIVNGNGKIVQCSVQDFAKVFKQCHDVDGLSVSFEGSQEDVERIVNLFNLDVTSTQSICGLEITCGNSAKVFGGVVLDGKRVNLQIAYKDGTVTVGSPLILGSY